MLGATPIRVRLYLGIYAHVYIDVHIHIVYTAQNGCKYSWDISALLHFIDFAYLRLFCFCFFFLKHIYSIFILWVHFSLVLRHLKKMLKTNFSASRVFIISFLQVINVVHFYLLFVILFLVFLDFLLYLGSDRSKI